MARIDGVLFGSSAPGRLPVWFSLLLLGQLAGLICVFGLASVHLLQHGEWRWPWSLYITCVLGTVVMGILFYPLHLALAAAGIVNRWAYVAGALVAFGVAYLLLTVDDESGRSLVDIISNPVSSLAYQIPLVAIPVGLLFHQFVWRSHLRQPFSAKDLFLAATLVLMLLEVPLTLPLSNYRYALQLVPSDWRYEFVRHIFLIGLYTMPWAALAAGFIRLIDQKAALAVACVGWLMPAALPVGYLVVASRPRIVDFTAAGRTYDFPLQVEPRAEPQGGFSFYGRGQGPFQGQGIVNARLYVSDAPVPLFRDSLRPDDAAVEKSVAGDFSVETYTNTLKRPIRVYFVLGLDGQPTTVIHCETGFCLHCFAHERLRYCFHGEPTAYRQWRDSEAQSIALLEQFRRR